MPYPFLFSVRFSAPSPRFPTSPSFKQFYPDYHPTIKMGCVPSHPSSPFPQPRRQNEKPRTQNASRLSRPFDPNIPLYVPQKRDQNVRPVDPARYGDAYAQLNARSKPKTVQPVDPGRYGDAYAQLNSRSKQTRQAPRTDQKVHFAQGPRVQSQKAQQFKGDSLYFAS